MENFDPYHNVHPVLLKYLYDVTTEELATINGRVKEYSDDQIAQFCVIYRSRRKDAQTILITCLLGLVGVSGVHRFILDQVGMGILYFFTGGLCLVGTIVDAVNHKNLTLEYNSKKIVETLAMLNMLK